jgi:hypothetical protein
LRGKRSTRFDSSIDDGDGTEEEEKCFFLASSSARRIATRAISSAAVARVDAAKRKRCVLHLLFGFFSFMDYRS